MIALIASLLLAQDPLQAADARERADGARRTCAGLVAGTDGLSMIGMAGSGTEYKLLLVVRDPAVKKAIQDRLGGDQCNGLPILWSVKNPTAQSLTSAAAVAPAAAIPDVGSPSEADDSSTLDYRRRCWPPTYVWTYTPPGWWRPWIVWEYNNGWRVCRLHRQDYGSGKIRWRY